MKGIIQRFVQKVRCFLLHRGARKMAVVCAGSVADVCSVCEPKLFEKLERVLAS